ncbi:ubiquitin-protein ligase E3C [Eupeodes corollae]|uniref:ubiquitin-protein ligase E3C n=1 Tax=Eupeodes corollae TaxID=290404 RepID=UPI0024934A24|nr:ubiquitin-protein ligase E3C [Eupeodes corollae]
MYSFDGDYRRRPVQNLGGASQSCDRETIIKKAQIERQKRNELRKQNNGAIVLQSYTRSFILRQRQKKLERDNFDEFFKSHKDKLTEDDNLAYLLRRILFFYSNKVSKDCERLIELSQYLLRNPSKMLENAVTGFIWLHRLRKLMIICIEQLTVPNSSQAIPMRMVETFTSESIVERYIEDHERVRLYLELIFRYLVERNYFKRIRKILEEKCPPLDGETLHAPNQVTEALFQMIMRPLVLVNRGFRYGKVICQSFNEHILSKSFSDPIRNYILPCLAEQPEFPFKDILRSLEPLIPVATLLEGGVDKMQVDGDDRDRDDGNPIFSSFLLNSILILDRNQLDTLKENNILNGYIKVISEVSPKILVLPKSSIKSTHLSSGHNAYDEDDEDEEEDDEEDELESQSASRMSIDPGKDSIQTGLTVIERNCLLEVIELLNDSKRVHIIVDNIEHFINDADVLYALCKTCHNMMIYNKNAIFDYKLLYTLAFMPTFIRAVWFTLASQSSQLGFSSPLSLISKGVVPKQNGVERTIPLLATFCSLFGRLVPTLHDTEFCEDSMFEKPQTLSKLMPFKIDEIVQLSKTLKEISLGLVELAFPETRSNLNEHYRWILGRSELEDKKIKHQKQIWANLLKVTVSVLNQIHTRDLRLGFCPDTHWTVSKLNLPLDRPSDLPLTRGSRTRGIRPFQPIRDFTREDFENGPPMSTKQIRSITILREIPFVVPFSKRVGILQGLVAADKMRVQGNLQAFLQGPSILLTVRRSHLYEDAFDKLRPENEPDLRLKFRVQFVSSLGLDEAGIDGGGVFREFLSELIKTSFDPNRGFFMVTTDNKLYPNPNVGDLFPDFERHYYFIGRILGKAIYENLLVELPLAEFFLTKLAGKYSDVDVHQLASLDPELYKNLLCLKDYEGDVSELNLDFTVVTSSLGQTQVQDLKPNGQSIPVTSSNRIEYIQLIADYKLNKQIRQHCVAFRKGLSNVLPVEWLYMFSNKELQILISGAEIPIDLEDLKKHCKYGGEYSPEHPSIICFWAVLEGFSDLQKRQLLKFVTSCSRPPLLGFKDLDPPFFIQNAGDMERLPTASTCTNLLKLPPFKTEEQMREKLLYAIQSNAGFELS